MGSFQFRLARFQPASSLLVSLIILTTIFSLIFLFKDDLISREKITQNYYQNYLNSKLKVFDKIKQNKQQECEHQKKEKIVFEFEKIKYQFNCVQTSLFIQPKPTRDKYIAVDDIHRWLDLDTYQQAVVYIKSLAELPNSSEQAPRIAIALNDIDENITKDFYGIIITDYYFDIKGSRKMYGVLYSSFDNAREERNLTYRRAVVDNLEKMHSQWHYLTHSQTILNYD
ncbi:hypothetical protein BMT54_02120 [Pasteurellaceae bacterium 15-036681]|nr:hypothetical protein BMT54_02120 [Pasteurellaceae bacterium 15-036681]